MHRRLLAPVLILLAACATPDGHFDTIATEARHLRTGCVERHGAGTPADRECQANVTVLLFLKHGTLWPEYVPKPSGYTAPIPVRIVP